MYRDHTKTVTIGNRVIGGGNPVLIQSMTNTKTEDVAATAAQIQKLTKAGCDIIRCAVPTKEAADALERDQESRLRFRLWQIFILTTGWQSRRSEAGADKIRINPGNIGSKERVRAVVEAAKERNIPIRVGVNSGSLEKEIW